MFADYLETNSNVTNGKTILELGAGAGLPSLMSSIKGASHVLVTDYPDADLIENLQYNIDHCSFLPSPRNILARGFLWGADVEPLTATLPAAGETGKRFDVLILADLLFNHSEHQKLLSSVQETLKRTAEARALVFFTPYRPWLLENDLNFFAIAKEGGFEVEKIFEKTMDKVMFEEDRGVSVEIVVQFCFLLSSRAPPPLERGVANHGNRTSCFDGRSLVTSCGGRTYDRCVS